MKIMKSLAVLTATIITTSCSVESQKRVGPIGKFDNNVKGYIVEDMPAFTSKTMQQELNKKIINPSLKWQHLDLGTDRMFGVSADLAYKDFNLSQSKEIIVAVIDSGVDIEHEDLKDVIWVNEAEIPNNGIDDDNNGYIDDMHGWNFIGGKDGSHINEETLEETRIYKTLLTKLQNGELLSQAEGELYTEVKKVVETNFKEYNDKYQAAKEDQSTVVNYLNILKVKIGIQNIDSREKISSIQSKDPKVMEIKVKLLKLWDKYWRGFIGIPRAIESSKYYATVGYNINNDARARIVGDDPSDFSDTDYGNNDVKGPDSSHGTHVSGIIAAKRDNEVGINGIAANVKIMALRAVPNGDERDKDIALAVRYAADNGASIINMSFGKKYSPYKAEVDAAFKYAASKGVLLVHAAGNSALNIDGGTQSFPNHYIADGSGVLVANQLPNWLEIGASTKNNDLTLIANFSNYGNEAVTLFSPGHKIYSTTPNNQYEAYSGTSMATPVVAGVAALLMSEFPTMNAKEALDILVYSVKKPVNLQVKVPGNSGTYSMWKPFIDFSSADGVINIFSAVELAKKLSRSR